MTTLTVRTGSRTEFRDITRDVARAVGDSGVERGAAVVYVPHTTAGVTINENADPSVRADIEGMLERLVPWEGPYRHTEGNSAAHIKATLCGSSVTVPVEGRALALGTWQGVFLCEFDGPRARSVQIRVLAGAPTS